MSGGPQRRITTERVMDVFRETGDRCEPFSAPEVGERLDCHRHTARQRLNELVEVGALETKRIGSGRAYWRSCGEVDVRN